MKKKSERKTKNNVEAAESEAVNKFDGDLIGLTELLNATKGEYVYLQNARNSLHTRVGILIALLTALVSAVFARNTVGFIDLFKANIVIAHLRVISLSALFVTFVVALITYVKVFFTRDYRVFPYANFTSLAPERIMKEDGARLVIAYYKEYAKCVAHNEMTFDSTVKHYKFGNKWLIAVIISAVVSIIISLI